MGCRAGRADPEIASSSGELGGGKGAVEVGPVPLTYLQMQPVGSRTPGAHVLTCAHSTQAGRLHMHVLPFCPSSPQFQEASGVVLAELPGGRGPEVTEGAMLQGQTWRAGPGLRLLVASRMCSHQVWLQVAYPSTWLSPLHRPWGFTPPAARPPEASLPWQAAPRGAWPGFWRLREAGVVWPCTHPPWLERGRCGERHLAPTWWPLKARAGHSCSCPAQPARSPW